jgi:hypothetical protein
MSVRQVLDTVEGLLKDPAIRARGDDGIARGDDRRRGRRAVDDGCAAEDLLLEFIPSIHDGSRPVIGTPTLLPQRSGYAFDIGDAIIMDRALIDRVLNEGASGFTIIVALRAVSLVGSDYTFLTYTDPAHNGALQIAIVAGGDGAHVRVSSLVSYDPAHYESLDNAGNLAVGAHVIALRYRRSASLGARLDVWVDGIPAVPAGAPGFDVGGDPAGVVDTYADGTVYLGDNPDPNWGSAPNTPAGAVWGWKTALDDETIALAMQRALSHYPVEA